MNVNLYSNGKQEIFTVEKTGMILFDGIWRVESREEKKIFFGDIVFFTGTTSNPICQSAIMVAEKNGRGTISSLRRLVEVDLFASDINLIRNGKGQVVSITFGSEFKRTLDLFGKRIDFKIFENQKEVNEFIWNQSSAFRKVLKLQGEE